VPVTSAFQRGGGGKEKRRERGRKKVKMPVSISGILAPSATLVLMGLFLWYFFLHMELGGVEKMGWGRERISFLFFGSLYDRSSAPFSCWFFQRSGYGKEGRGRE